MASESKQVVGKNIIVCADGTGNQGGYTPDSNVYKTYKSVDKRFEGVVSDDFTCKEQIVFYDNGVGTQKNKYLRALSGGLGFGFAQNICDLYSFLARNYEPGDHIYFFGFSRGASTVRACNGFISKCGLIKGKGTRNSELTALVKEAFAAYRQHETRPELAESQRTSDHSHGIVPVHFMGVWDTVVALGFPSRTDVTGAVSGALNNFFIKVEKALDRRWPHKFYHYKLTDNVKYAYQALAIDDERTAFWPRVWREQGRCEESRVEQVWFAGMHSNVGGGYERSGMASAALYWMMLRAQKSGLRFEEGALLSVLNDSNAHGRLYNSRDGAGVVYRYHPREIETLCKGRMDSEIRLHRSVLERINHRTANYAPGQLPGRFAVVDDEPDSPEEIRSPGNHADWKRIREEIDGWVYKRKCLYERVLTAVLAFLALGLVVWSFADEPKSDNALLVYIADTLDYIVPGVIEPLVHWIIYNPWVLLILALPGRYYFNRMKEYRANTVKACEDLRHIVIDEASDKDSESPAQSS